MGPPMSETISAASQSSPRSSIRQPDHSATETEEEETPSRSGSPSQYFSPDEISKEIELSQSQSSYYNNLTFALYLLLFIFGSIIFTFCLQRNSKDAHVYIEF